MGNRNTSVISVRIPEEIKEKLENESKIANLTLNTMIGQILSRFVSWDRFAEDTGFVFIQKHFLKDLLVEINEKKD